MFKEGLLTQPDTVIHYPFRIVSARITKILLRTSITPNQVTIFRGILNAIALYFLTTGNYIYFIGVFILFQINELLDHVDGELARVGNMQSQLGVFLEYLVDVPGSTMYGLFGLCTSIGVHKQANSFTVFWVFISIIIGTAFKNAFYYALVKPKGKAESDSESTKWFGIMRNTTIKEKLKIVITLISRWQNQIILWGALLYYPIDKYLHFNPLFWGMVCIALMTQLQWLKVVYNGYRNAIAE